MKKSPIIITIMLMITNIVVKFLGLLRDIVLANTYGTSMYSDAYIVANNIPIVLFTVLSTAISTSFIPMYSEVNEKEGDGKALLFANNFINILLVISIFITIIGELFPDLLVKIFASGFTQEAYNLTIKFTQILLPSVIVISLMSVSGSYLQLKNDFLPISYVSLPNNIIVIISIIIAFYYDKPYLLAVGTVIGMFSQLIYYYPFMKKNKFKYKLYFNLKDEYLKRTIIMVLPVFIGAAVNEINVIVDRSLVSGLEQGSIAALNYASKLTGFITGVFIVSIVTIVYPKMSSLSVKNDMNKLKEYIVNIFESITVIIIPISVISIIYSNDIVRIIFERGSFDSKSTYMTAISLAAYSIGLVGIGYREILTKVYFSIKDTKTPMVNGVFAVILNIILNIILIKRIGFIGSAISTSIVAIFTSLLLSRSLKYKIGKIFKVDILINFAKILISAILSTLLTSNIYNMIQVKDGFILQLISLCIIIVLNLIIYLIFLIILKENIVQNSINNFKNNKMRNKNYGK